MPKEIGEPSQEEMGPKPTEGNENFEQRKAKARQELKERFGMEKTDDFRQALRQGRVDKALEWLAYIEENRENFPQYDDNWYKDRHQEIGQQEVFERLGMRNTDDFRQALEEGRMDDAKKWLEYVRQNREKFPQYRDGWFADRKKEMDEVEKKG